jgi:predicted alpha/beta hydrolase family esterase
VWHRPDETFVPDIVRVFIVPGWSCGLDDYWYRAAQWLADGLGGEATIVEMSDGSPIDRIDRIQRLAVAVGVPDASAVLIGHSLGAVTILRYMESLPAGQSIGGAVLVAPFVGPIAFRDLDDFVTAPFDWVRIRLASTHIVAINSDDDPLVAIDHGERLGEHLGAPLVTARAAGHFATSTVVPAVGDAIETAMAVVRALPARGAAA